MNKFSILHISDIHKVNDVNYESLLHSIKKDMLNWECEGIVKPSFIVISGDLIQGAETDEKIAAQYQEVTWLLEELTKLILDGHKERLIMVPGNHDVNWSRSSSSMEPSDEKEADNDYEKYFEPILGDVRWDWKARKFFKIKNTGIYNSRFELFAKFYNDFYHGIYTFPAEPIKEASLIPFDEEKIAFACFNSNYKLDHLNHSGSIDEDAITNISEQLEDYFDKGYLPIGVWHHNYYGEPRQSDYMDKSIFAPMLAYKLRIGLFGHQHIAQVAEEYANMEESEESRKENKLLLISSGTLFGFEKVLRPGQKRQYNIIEIEMGNGIAEVAICTREDSNPNVNSKIPMWRFKEVRQSVDNKIHAWVFFKKMPIMNYILEIDKRAKTTGNYEAACEELESLGLDNVEVRKFFDDYIGKTQKGYIISKYESLRTAPGFILLCGAVIKERNKIVAKRILDDPEFTKASAIDVLLQEIIPQLEDITK